MKDFEFHLPQPTSDVKESFVPSEKTDKRRASNGRAYQIQNLWEKHHKIKRLAFLGWTQVDIAKELGMSNVSISTILNSEVMKRELELMRGAADMKALDIREQLDENARKAAVLLHEFMTDQAQEPSLRARIAMDSLSRAGYAPQVNVKGEIRHHFTTQEIEDIKRAALAHNGMSESDSEEPIDVPFSEVN